MNAQVECFSIAGGADAVGTEALAGIRERLAGGAALIVNRDDGFTRISSRLAQHVEAAAPRLISRTWATRISSRIPVRQDVHGNPEEIECLLTRLNESADCYRYVYDGASSTVSSVQCAIVDAGTLDWWTPLLATAFALQLQRAEHDADLLGPRLRGRVASAGSPHIVKFRRPVRPAPRLAPGPQPADRRGNRFANQFEFDAIAEYANGLNAFAADATAAGVVIDAPFDRTTGQVRLNSNLNHPRAGEGLTIFVLLPIFGRYDEVARLAAWLNRREAAGEILAHGLGAWAVVEDGEQCGLRHHLFVPKDAWASGIAFNLARATLWKLGAINALLNPGVPEANVLNVVEKRYAQVLPALADAARRGS